MKAMFYQVTRSVLPARVKRRIVNWAAQLDREGFADIAHAEFMAPSMARGLRRLAERGLQPRHVVDVGAFHGDWSLMMARKIWPEAQITMLEANREKSTILESVAERIGARIAFEVLGLIGASGEQSPGASGRGVPCAAAGHAAESRPTGFHQT